MIFGFAFHTALAEKTLYARHQKLDYIKFLLDFLVCQQRKTLYAVGPETQLHQGFLLWIACVPSKGKTLYVVSLFTWFLFSP